MLPTGLAQWPINTSDIALYGGERRIYTDMAPESCFASGVDHCLASDDDCLRKAEVTPYFPCVALRKHLRAWAEIMGLITVVSQCYRDIFWLRCLESSLGLGWV